VSEYVKFTCECATAEITSFGRLAELNAYRANLLDLGLIGVDSNGVGFGNLSVRDDATDNFYITGSATGGMPELTLAECAKVVAYDFDKNWVRYEGLATPSSESLTHAAIYESDAKAEAILHCHDLALWESLLNQGPTTSKAAEYGTPELAYEIMRLFKCTDVQSRKIFVMAGHEGGIIAFGNNLDEAFCVLIRERKEI
jgi:L-ribulose-5-phosphate 4-epimerase